MTRVGIFSAMCATESAAIFVPLIDDHAVDLHLGLNFILIDRQVYTMFSYSLLVMKQNFLEISTKIG